MGKGYETIYTGVESFKNKTEISWPLTRALIETGKELYEKGFYLVEHKYILKNNLLVFNRSKEADSNFFVFVKAKDKKELDIFFSNPSMDPKIKREELILRFSIKGNEDIQPIAKKINDIFNKAIEISKVKKKNEYWGCLHSHIGTIKGERVWDDGITEDESWFLQSMLWHHDFHALTSHNWTHNEERLNWMNGMLSSANMVFIPGWENTTTIEDRVKSPHILVLCKNIETAMKAKYEFLSKKLADNYGETVTPILSGVPGPYTKHLNYLSQLHKNKDAAIFIAHPSSKDVGIDILDPSNLKSISENTIHDLLFNFADGVEGFNFKEINSEEVTLLYIMRLIKDELGYNFHKLNHMSINYYIGLIAKKHGLFVLANQDDHYQPSIDSSILSDYSYGHNKLVLSTVVFNYFKEQLRRKFTSEEFVHAIVNKRFLSSSDSSSQQSMSSNKNKKLMENSDEKIMQNSDFALEPITALNIESENIQLFENREQTTIEKIKTWIQSEPAYYWNIAKLQFKYWFADKKQKKEIRAELEKAKAYNLKAE